MRARPAALALTALIAVAAGCGGGVDDVKVDRGQLRECLAGAGFKSDQGGGAGDRLYLGALTPDFRGQLGDGNGLAVVIEPNQQRAERDAADVRSALSLYASDPDRQLVQGRNALLVFEAPPSSEQRGALSGCLG